MLTDKAREVFDAEYLRIFPQGGDVSDHEEAVDSAVAAVVAWAHTTPTDEAVQAAIAANTGVDTVLAIAEPIIRAEERAATVREVEAWLRKRSRERRAVSAHITAMALSDAADALIAHFAPVSASNETEDA